MSSSSQSFAAGQPASLASPSQSHLFCGPAATASGGGSFDTLNHVISDLCSRGNPKEGAPLAFRRHVEEAIRDLSSEVSSRFVDQLNCRISKLIETTNVAENMDGFVPPCLGSWSNDF